MGKIQSVTFGLMLGALVFQANAESGSVPDCIADFLAANTLNTADDRQYAENLERKLNSENLTQTERLRVEDALANANKNKTGSQATDFSFILRDGTESSLYETLPSDDEGLLLLVFFDPDCDSCAEVMESMRKDPGIESAAAEGSLKILAVYAGSNENAWRRKAESFPRYWTVGMAGEEIEEEEIYDLPSMPSVYLLDSGGKVLSKPLPADF